MTESDYFDFLDGVDYDKLIDNVETRDVLDSPFGGSSPESTALNIAIEFVGQYHAWLCRKLG